MHSKDFEIHSYHAGKWGHASTGVIVETPVTLTVNNEQWLTFMCTPIDMEALAVGFLYNEEIIKKMDDIASVRVCPTEENIDVWLNHPVQKPETWERTSGCSGGKTSVKKNKVHRFEMQAKNGMLLPPEKICDLIGHLNLAQKLYRQTGGVHTSAISDSDQIILVEEDIGRHNTLDKLAGRMLIDKIGPAKRILLTTGRISSEMIQKADRMKTAMVISRTSPSSLSVQMADTMGITLIGYARANSFTVYTHPERILSIPIGEKVTSEEV